MIKNDLKSLLLYALFASFLFESCRVGSKEKTVVSEEENKKNVDTIDSKETIEPVSPAYFEIENKDWEELTAQEYAIDIRYATTNNFTNKKIYDCPRCLLRTEAAQALKLLDADLKRTYGYRLKMFDCFRPKDYQQRLWDVVPNPNYVTPPSKGSMHNRGLAVDLTIIDSLGVELEMGTEYDYFGSEAHFDYEKLPQAILDNRRFLRKKMEQYGFEGIRTEWWHFSYKSKSYPLSNYRWPCT
jgi:zinc D-Ala-D-Ala dipeptidase